MLRTWKKLGLALTVTSQLAFAQDASTQAAAPLKDKDADTFHEVERGVFLGVTGGPSFILNAPTVSGTDRPFSSGQMAQLEIGVDIGEVLSLSLFAQVSSNRAGADYHGNNPNGGLTSGDFAQFVPGVALRANLVGLPDAQGTRRTWFYLRGGAGYTLFYPSELFKGSDFLVFAGPGIEYYTRLRHFSIGVEVTATMLATSGALGFAVTPNLRYAF